MSAPTTWRGDDDNTPHRTRRVLRWYRLRLADWFQEMHQKHELDPALLDGLAEWFAERPDEFLIWKAEDEYRGGTYNLGCWRLDFAAMKPALAGAIKEIEAEQRLRAYASLGPVTGADVDAALALLHGRAPLPEEPNASNLVLPERQSALLHHKYTVEDYWPRLCRRCGESYKPAKRIQSRTCGDCLAAAKAEREAVREARA